MPLLDVNEPARRVSIRTTAMQTSAHLWTRCTGHSREPCRTHHFIYKPATAEVNIAYMIRYSAELIKGYSLYKTTEKVVYIHHADIVIITFSTITRVAIK